MDPGVYFGKDECKKAQQIVSHFGDDDFHEKYNENEISRAVDIVSNINMFALSPRHKKCKLCNQSKSVFDFRRNKQHLDGRDSVCKDCRNKQEKEKRMANKAISEKTKICSCCGKKLPITEFYNKRGAKDGHASYCKECARKKNKEAWAKYTAKKKEDNTIKDIEFYPVNLAEITDKMIFEQLEKRGYKGSLQLTRVETFSIGVNV